jgi:hypothetical protein
MNWFKPSKKASSNIWGMNSSKSTVKKKQSQSIYPRQLKQSKKSKPFSGVNLIVRLTQRRIGLQRSSTKPKAKRWFNLETRPAKLFKDTDRDGVADVFDCRPRNSKKQGIYHLPLSKKGYYRELRKRSPIVVRHKDGDLIETFGEKGITSYKRIREEKLAQLNADYPNEPPRTIQDQIDLEKGNARGVLARGRTPGLVIFKQRGYKPRSEYDYNYKKPEEKVRQLAVVNVKTGDIDTFQESSKWGKLAIEKERASYGGDPEKYYPLSELHRTQESSNIEVLNPSPIDLIRAKREKLREEARMEGIDVSGEFDKYPSKETVDAFMKVTKEQPIPEPEIIERAEPEPIRPPFKYEVVEPEPPEPEAKVYESIEEMPDLPEEEPSEAQELLDESANETEDKS